MVPIDFTSVGDCAVSHAVDIAKINGDGVCLMIKHSELKKQISN